MSVEREAGYIYSVIKYLLQRSRDDRTSHPRGGSRGRGAGGGEEESNEEAGITVRNKESRAISERWC